MAHEKADREQLEALVDKCDLDEVIRMLSVICSEKAEHVRTNWQDEKLAKRWDKNADILALTDERLLSTY